MYVQRNQFNKVVGVYANAQPGIASEKIASDHADIVKFFAPPLPQVVTMRQARLALFGAGLLAGVDAAIAALKIPERQVAEIEWEYAATVDRNSALVTTLAGALDLDEEKLDALFVAATQL